MSTIPLLSDAQAWQRLPAATQGSGQPLPSWARMLVFSLPRTTAALLQLDLAQRKQSPVAPGLRAAMRWVAAHANRCSYAEAYAVADGERAGIDGTRISALVDQSFAGWTPAEQAALKFAYKMTVDSDSVTDAEFAELVQYFGERQAASMVLLMAYANFQDRLLLCLKAPLEQDGPLPPVAVLFPPSAFVIQTTPPPPQNKSSLPLPVGQDNVGDDPRWKALTYDVLQQRLETQRRKPTRLRIPTWEEYGANLPEGMLHGPTDIVWSQIVFGYAPELAVPWELIMRTAGAEGNANWDRIFGSSLFWVTTKAVECPYCMGHCEMNWEVAGLTTDEIAARSRLLAGEDWSSFTPAEQRAFAFTRKLTRTPWEVSEQDVAQLQQDFGADRGLLVLFHSSRYHYMTRISNGFQLTLESENPFFDYYNMKAPAATAPATGEKPYVHLLSDAECWQRMPAPISGGGQALPNWAKAVAVHLPRTAAAMLRTDLAQRTRSPLDPILRGKMRWVIANANRCAYGKTYALADMQRAGANQAVLDVLQGDPSGWPVDDREPLEFARLMTVAAPTIPDALFERLRTRVGNEQVASMVLLAAYGNFQDRIVLGLNLPLEADGPLPPVAVVFSDSAFQLAPFVPPQGQITPLIEDGESIVPAEPEWSQTSYDLLQSRLEQQRQRRPRLPVPTWDEIKSKLPPAIAARPTRIVWNLVCYGYAAELAIPWSNSTRTMWAEFQADRIFEESLFWIQTRSVGCNYCMGHCEMLLEVAGLDAEAVAERTRRLASSDWSAFPPAEQRAYAYARKLSRTPWELAAADYATLEADFGPEQAMATFWWLCRGLYMTRISDGFQLPLEQENVFQAVPTVPTK